MIAPVWLLVCGVGSFAAGCLVSRWLWVRTQGHQLGADTCEAHELRAETATDIARRTEERLERIVALAHTEARITCADVEHLFCISEGTAVAYLNRLTRLRRLLRQSDSQGMYYTPVGVAPSKTAVAESVANDQSEPAKADQPVVAKRVAKRVRKKVAKKVAKKTTKKTTKK